MRVHLPLALRARGRHEAASPLEDLDEIDDESAVFQAAEVLRALSGGAPDPLLEDAVDLCAAALSGTPDGAWRAAQAAQRIAAAHDAGGPDAPSVVSPSGAPFALRALGGEEARRQRDEVLAASPPPRRGS